MKTAWDMTQAEREALWAANDAKYRFEDEDPWEAAQDIIEERRCIEGPTFYGDCSAFDTEWLDLEAKSCGFTNHAERLAFSRC